MSSGRDEQRLRRPRGSAAGGQRRPVPLDTKGPSAAGSVKTSTEYSTEPSVQNWSPLSMANRHVSALERAPSRWPTQGDGNRKSSIRYRPARGRSLICRRLEPASATPDVQAQLGPAGTRQASVGTAIGSPSPLAWPSCAGCSCYRSLDQRDQRSVIASPEPRVLATAHVAVVGFTGGRRARCTPPPSYRVPTERSSLIHTRTVS